MLYNPKHTHRELQLYSATFEHNISMIILYRTVIGTYNSVWLALCVVCYCIRSKVDIQPEERTVGQHNRRNPVLMNHAFPQRKATIVTKPCQQNCAINNFSHLSIDLQVMARAVPQSFFCCLSSTDRARITSVLSLHSFISIAELGIVSRCLPSLGFITASQHAAASDRCHVTQACWLRHHRLNIKILQVELEISSNQPPVVIALYVFKDFMSVSCSREKLWAIYKRWQRVNSPVELCRLHDLKKRLGHTSCISAASFYFSCLF